MARTDRRTPDAGAGTFGIGVLRPKYVENLGTLWRSAHALGASFLFTIQDRFPPEARRDPVAADPALGRPGDTARSWEKLPYLTFPSVDALRQAMPLHTLVGVEQTDGALDLPAFETEQSEGGGRVQLILPGDSIGRDSDSMDTDAPEDWDFLGGRDAIERTPREINLSRMGVVINPPPPPPPAPPEWTVMVYANADDWILERPIFADLNEIVRLYAPPGGTEADVFTGEEQMGEGATLRGFVQWAQANYPAQKYALVIGGHGKGWKEVSPDGSSARMVPAAAGEQDAIQIGELGGAVAGLSLDLLAFDACLMGMAEVAHEVRGGADVMVASEATEPAQGYPYGRIISALVATPVMTGADLGVQIVNDYDAFYAARGVDFRTMAAIDLGGPLTGLVGDVDALATALGATESATRNPDEVGGVDDHGADYGLEGDPGDNVQTAVGEALLGSEHFGKKRGDANFVDLGDLSGRVAADGRVQPEIQDLAQEVADDLAAGGVILAEAHGALHAAAPGLSVYFPSAQTKETHPHEKIWAVNEEPYDAPLTPVERAPGDALVKYGPDLDPASCGLEDPDHPLPNAPDFDFPADTDWNEFLMRFYTTNETLFDVQITDTWLTGELEYVCTPELRISGPDGEGDDQWDVIDPFMWLYCEDPYLPGGAVNEPDIEWGDHGDSSSATYSSVDLQPGETLTILVTFIVLEDLDQDDEITNDCIAIADGVGQGFASSSTPAL